MNEVKPKDYWENILRELHTPRNRLSRLRQKF
jgi:hypothetical protein